MRYSPYPRVHEINFLFYSCTKMTSFPVAKWYWKDEQKVESDPGHLLILAALGSIPARRQRWLGAAFCLWYSRSYGTGEIQSQFSPTKAI
jgi:hypothetical protein